MFIKKYIKENFYNQIIDNYEKKYLEEIDEEQFVNIYSLFKCYNFKNIDNIALYYLEIFNCDYEYVKSTLDKLRKIMGNNFVSIIENNLRYLKIFLRKN